YITALEKFANEGGMITEQVWDDEDLPNGRMKKGAPTGAAMPLCWSHAEYLSLVRSRHDGVCFDHIEPAFHRYVSHRVKSQVEFWRPGHQTRRLPGGKTLRLLLPEPAAIVWTADNWASTQKSETCQNVTFNLAFADLPTTRLPVGAAIEFTLFW